MKSEHGFRILLTKTISRELAMVQIANGIIDGPNAEFALRLISQRRDAALTQDQLAKSVGIDKRSISMYENGRMFPRGETLKRLAKELGVDAMWLATGMTEEMHNYLTNQYSDRDHLKLPAQVELLFIEEWPSIKASRTFRPTYNPNPTGGWQSANIYDFVPVVKTSMDQYRAARFPGTHPSNPCYSAGSILIFDAALRSANQIGNGNDVIFKFRGDENEPGLRRLVREPGLGHADLISVDQTMPPSPIPFDHVDIEIIGVVVSQIIPRLAPKNSK